ncbi:cysteine peptidase family C39 domain-containing protein [Terasakiella sp. SH-1]|uniref:cysteine peptidase family C39 domain-containing protein n=1 Tax=Terasakiella sp. SH-1 TaxID=2560057 RepID=UPI00143144DC|nr:cysteine peptidase family C39 domain-containing protein [Terasakiella sp. SH-1]
MLSQFYERPAEADQIKHASGKSGIMSSEDLLLAAKELEFKAKAVETKWDRLTKTPLPAIARRPDGRFFILAKVSEDKVLIQCPEAGQPEQLSRDELEEAWDGTLILLTTRAQIAGEQRKFDISWFIPAFMKYRRLFGEVLLASFFLQVFAVISPLFFQVIIDKVLVHRGLTSLDVLIIAMIAVGIFEVLIGGLRTYIFSHTTNRVDVELGARLFWRSPRKVVHIKC